MFDIGWTEIAIIAVIAIIVIGPKDLPKAMREIARWVSKARNMAGEFRGMVDDMIKEAELEEVKNTASKINDFTAKKQIENFIDPDGDIKKAMDFSGIDAEPGKKDAAKGDAAAPVTQRKPEYDEDDGPDETAALDIPPAPKPEKPAAAKVETKEKPESTAS